MTYEEYVSYDAMGLAQLVKKGEVKPAELAELALKRADDVNPKINAIVHRYDALARAAAAGGLPDGPFRGVPFLLKNLLDGALAGTPLTMGCRALRNHVAPHDSEIVTRYKRSGVVMIGSTNSPEFGLMGTTEPALYGPTRNPWNLDLSSGGSSGGAAAAVAAGIVPAAHASDGGGSIRIPASACGLFGIKPTRGRMPLGPDASDCWNGFAIPHVLTRSVRDSAALLDVAQGADVGAPYASPAAERPFVEELLPEPGKLRIGMTVQSILGRHSHPDCIAACEDAARLTVSLGHSVELVTLPIDADEMRMSYLTVIGACTAADISLVSNVLGRPVRASEFEPATWFMKQIGDAMSAADLERARASIGKMTRAIAQLFANMDVLLTPTLAHPPVRIGELDLKSHERAGLAVLRHVNTRHLLKNVLAQLAPDLIEKTPNTMLFNMTGQPAMNVPLHWNAAGVPIGVQFVGRFGAEATLFRLAQQLELARPWFDRLPVICSHD